jgi:acyl-coenzyme A thioesterase PaaI-like protein
MASLDQVLPVTDATVLAAYDFVFAPWVKQLGLCNFSVREGYVSALLPESAALQFSSGAVCGQAIMAAVDTLAALAMSTTERRTKGTTYQHTHFLRPAKGGPFLVEAKVLRFGASSAFAEARVLRAADAELIAQAALEFAF